MKNFISDNRGEGNKALIAIIVLGILGGYIALKIIPVHMDNSKLERAVKDEFTYRETKDVEGFRIKVLEAASELGIEPEDEDVIVEPTEDGRGLDIEIYYEKEVKFPGYTYTAKFEIYEELRGSWLATLLDKTESRVTDAYQESFDRIERMSGDDSEPPSGGGRKPYSGFADKARDAADKINR